MPPSLVIQTTFNLPIAYNSRIFGPLAFPRIPKFDLSILKSYSVKEKRFYNRETIRGKRLSPWLVEFPLLHYD